jgi:outer membrane protein assembly factor BamB
MRSLYAISNQGTIQWTDSVGSFIHGTPAVDNAGNLYCWLQDSIQSLTSTGTRRWSRYTRHSNWDLTIDCQGNIDYLSGGTLYSLTNTGQERWTCPVDSYDDVTSVISDNQGTCYALTGSSLNKYTLRAISIDGAVLWKIDLDAYAKYGGMAISTDGFLILSDTGDSNAQPNSLFVVE